MFSVPLFLGKPEILEIFGSLDTGEFKIPVTELRPYDQPLQKLCRPQHMSQIKLSHDNS